MIREKVPEPQKKICCNTLFYHAAPLFSICRPKICPGNTLCKKLEKWYNDKNLLFAEGPERGETMEKDEEKTEQQEELEDIIRLTDENGNDVSYEFLDFIEYRDGAYVVLCEPGGNEVIILEEKGLKEEGKLEYVDVEDEEILNAVFDIFKEHSKDEFDFPEG